MTTIDPAQPRPALAVWLKRLFGGGLFLLVLAVAAWPRPVLAAGVFRSGSWIAVCNNLRTCKVVGLSRESLSRPQGTAPYLRIDRTGEAGALPEVVLVAPPTSRGARRLTHPWRIEVDEFVVRGAGNSPGTYDLNWAPGEDVGSAYLYRGFEDKQAQALLAALRTGRRLAIDRGPDPEIAIDLAGLGETLAWVDAQQLRTGSKSALWAPGPGPETVEPLPALQVVKAAPEVEQDKVYRPSMPQVLIDAAAQAGCAELSPNRLANRLAGGMRVWGAYCREQTGASWAFLYLGREDGADAKPLILPVPPAEDPATFRSEPSGWSADARYLGQFPWKTFCGRDVDWIWTGSEYVVAGEWEILDCFGVLERDRASIFVTDVK